MRGEVEGEEEVIDDLRGVDDWIAEIALAWRARQRHLAGELCRRRFTHQRREAPCACVRPVGHDHDCLCEHGIERVVYWIDFDGREHYATRALLPTVGGPL